jgi:hypothetical protein
MATSTRIREQNRNLKKLESQNELRSKLETKSPLFIVAPQSKPVIHYTVGSRLPDPDNETRLVNRKICPDNKTHHKGLVIRNLSGLTMICPDNETHMNCK